MPDLMDLIGDEPIDIECPECNRKIRLPFKKVSKPGASTRCPGCNSTIKFNNGQAQDTINQANKKLKDTFKKLK